MEAKGVWHQRWRVDPRRKANTRSLRGRHDPIDNDLDFYEKDVVDASERSGSKRPRLTPF